MCRVVAADALDLDHVGAEVGEHHAARRARHDLRKLEHLHAGERARHPPYATLRAGAAAAAAR